MIYIDQTIDQNDSVLGRSTYIDDSTSKPFDNLVGDSSFEYVNSNEGSF
jgi:hypothetical protein